jgi:hypothetical protein
MPRRGVFTINKEIEHSLIFQRPLGVDRVIGPFLNVLLADLKKSSDIMSREAGLRAMLAAIRGFIARPFISHSSSTRS